MADEQGVVGWSWLNGCLQILKKVLALSFLKKGEKPITTCILHERYNSEGWRAVYSEGWEKKYTNCSSIRRAIFDTG